ncbi:MAG: Uncharacterised protein [Flavobacteriales bacterium]|jgi:hypothetical protein|nr:MAG: hypothetical protein DBW73_03100 [Flavobacteriales bacterium]CAI8249542.1 MAG: Uncharacterised protein [Flavobacteriales bacterium]|tara:strand:+ start:5223 stop:5921 length:699 start_codon:yes stop_codon:yes gene_type:complete
MLKYYINFYFLLFCVSIWAQNEVKTDSLTTEIRYGIRLGIDMSKPLRMLLDPDYKGLELVSDYRLTRNLYIAAELGSETKKIDQDAVNFETSGTYLKLGVDYNVYDNWAGMDNLIVVGFRYGFSQHSQTLLGYNVLNNDHYWEEDDRLTIPSPNRFDGLNGHWIELQLGFKAELFRNFYMGVSLQMHRLLSDKDPENFENLFIPGFNKVLTDNPYGAGLNYTISYQLPIYKK